MTDAMVELPGGSFTMGSDVHYPEEAPAHEVTVAPFAIDAYQVTNAQFDVFVADTGYLTTAERPADPKDYPGALPEMLAPASSVFVRPTVPVSLDSPYNWWRYIQGADWRHPQGPDSNIYDKALHPVVHVTYADAVAYADWAGKRLPTEQEWEYAARGGLHGKAYVWGDSFLPKGRVMAQTWHGEFPMQNMLGRFGTVRVGTFQPNGYGLYDMAGNAWELTSTWYTSSHAENLAPAQHSCCAPDLMAASIDPELKGITIPRRVMKGGSHLCSPNYCQRYRPAARMPQPVDTSTSHAGFRCVTTTMKEN